MREIDLVVIHCSATPDGVFVSPEQIDRWHAERGFLRSDAAYASKYRPHLKHIGYHWVITADGSLCPGRHREEIGAHVQGYNAKSVGICMTGTDHFYAAQWNALRFLVCTIAMGLAYRVPDLESASVTTPDIATNVLKHMGVRVCGHRDLSPDSNNDGVITPNEWLKTCPGFDVADWMKAGMQPLPTETLDNDPRLAKATAIARVAA